MSSYIDTAEHIVLGKNMANGTIVYFVVLDKLIYAQAVNHSVINNGYSLVNLDNWSLLTSLLFVAQFLLF